MAPIVSGEFNGDLKVIGGVSRLMLLTFKSLHSLFLSHTIQVSDRDNVFQFLTRKEFSNDRQASIYRESQSPN